MPRLGQPNLLAAALLITVALVVFAACSGSEGTSIPGSPASNVAPEPTSVAARDTKLAPAPTAVLKRAESAAVVVSAPLAITQPAAP